MLCSLITEGSDAPPPLVCVHPALASGNLDFILFVPSSRQPAWRFVCAQQMFAEWMHAEEGVSLLGASAPTLDGFSLHLLRCRWSCRGTKRDREQQRNKLECFIPNNIGVNVLNITDYFSPSKVYGYSQCEGQNHFVVFLWKGNIYQRA